VVKFFFYSNHVLVKLVVLLLIFVYAGCSSQISKIDSESSIEPFFSIQFSSIKDTANIYIEDLVDDFVILPLDDNKEALCAPLTVYITEQHIGMTPSERGGTYKLFSRDGRFLCNVGGFGQGPGEYTSLLYHQIDEKAKRVYLNTFNATKIMAYDFNGKYLYDIPLTFTLRKGSFRVDDARKIIYCFDVPAGQSPFVWKQDFKGNIKGRVNYYPYTLKPDFGNDVQTMFNTEAFYTSVSAGYEQLEGMKDTLYHYCQETDLLVPVFSVDFGKEGQMHRYLNTALNYYVGLFSGYVANNGPYTTLDYKVIRVEKKTHKASYIKLFSRDYGKLPLDLYYAQFRYGYFFLWMEPSELKEQLLSVLKSSKIDMAIRSKIKQLCDNLSENGNCVLLFGKLKEK
jgi:hypothetical protein